MKQATKGAMAAVTAVALLSGGAGTLAYWTGTADVTGGSISAGKLQLSTPVCSSTADAATHDWQYSDGSAFNLSTSKVVPGDTLTRICKTTLDMSGDHIAATLSLTQPTFATSATDSLDTELTPTATFLVDNLAYSGTITGAGTHSVLATVTVTFTGSTATNTSQAVAATLSNATITATQAPA